MSRWKVKGVYGEHQLSPFVGGGTIKCTRWTATYYGEDEFSYHCVEFETHAEAMAYADKMARTITVTLPRGPHEIRGKAHYNESPITVDRVESSCGRQDVAVRFTAQGIPNHMFLAHDELEPLALTLLAHARRHT